MASRNVELIGPIYQEWEPWQLAPTLRLYDEHMERGWSSEAAGLAGVYQNASIAIPGGMAVSNT